MKRKLVSAALVVAVAAIATAAAATSAAPRAATPSGKAPPPKQVAALKRENTRLRRENARLKKQVAALQEQLRASSPGGVTAQLAQVKAALDKYQSVDQARADGYAPASPCESSPQGGMGFHYVSGAAMGDGRMDPMRPEILLYAPAGAGLQLIGVEYFKPDADQNLSTDDDRPTVFGRQFDGPMLGHAPGMPIHYDLHVWLWKRNPSGVFAVWNPDVACF
jgi:hypothetical protein